MRVCGLEIEQNQHSFLCCHFQHVENVLHGLYNIDLAINELELNEDSIINYVLFGSDKYHNETNRKTLLNCITYLKATKRFVNHLTFTSHLMNHRQQISCFCVMCVCICMYMYVYAKYHKSCKNKYGNYHLNCIIKKNENLDKEIEI